EEIEHIEWRYTLKPSTINISRFEDEQLEYLEIAVLQVDLNTQKRKGRIAQLIQKTIPYPLIIVFICDDEMALNVAEKRINRADSNKIVVDAIHDTGTISLERPTASQSAFLADFCISNFSYQNFYTFYQDVIARIIGLNCAVHSGHYSLETQAGCSINDRVQALRQIEKLQQERIELCNKLKKEKNLGTQVQLNTRVKSLRDRIEELRKGL
ncbi:MAG: DUF4391 domain-containing protein, partial [Nitrospiria bacterium]